MVVSLDAKRTMAENTGEVEGRSEGEIFYEKKDGSRVHVKHSDFDPEDCKRIISGTIEVYRRGRKPERRTAIFSQFDKSKQPGGEIWLKHPSLMILKCAESHGTTAAFPLETAGMYIPEELDTNGPIDVTATVVSEKTEPAKPESKPAVLPSPEKPPIEQSVQEQAKEPVRRGRPKNKPQGVTAPPFDDPPPPTEEPAGGAKQTPMGLDAEKEAPPQRPRTAVDVWKAFKEHCHQLKGSEVAERAFIEAFASVSKRFSLGLNSKIEDIPDDMVLDLRMYLMNTVLRELREENWLPIERQD
jgi:hypothetical protein